MNAVDVLCRILSSNCSMELKGNSTELCCVLFGNTRIRSTVAAVRCVEPLLSLLISEFSPSHHSVVRALDKLLDDDQLADLVAAHGAVVPLVSLLFDKNSGIIESLLSIFDEAPDFLCVAFAELLIILTNNFSIAKGHSAAKVVDSFFLLLTRLEIGLDGQHSVLQVLVNILDAIMI